MDAPLTTFSGFLKQIDVTGSDYIVRAAFQSAFSNFWSYASENRKSRKRIAARLKDAEVVFQHRHNRRFAGAEDFPNGRYFTICADAFGDDSRTMLDELTAYSADSSGPFFAFDLGYDHGRAGLEQWGPFELMPHSQKILLIFDASKLNEKSPLRKLAYKRSRRWANSLFSQGRNAIVVEAPYKVTEVVIPNSLDLRQIDAQRWLSGSLSQQRICRFAKTLEELFQTKKGQAVLLDDSALQTLIEAPNAEENFLRWLPALVAPAPGGNGLTESIGRFLRLNQVSALIYPSARTNCGAIQRGGQLSTCWGWNLVDYRNSKFHSYDLTLEADPIDVLEIGKAINVRSIDSGEFAGTWLLLRGLDVIFNDRDGAASRGP
jgi:hypothetical protein